MLKLRALRTNGDWDSYLQHHLAEEHTKVHAARYLDRLVPKAGRFQRATPECVLTTHILLTFSQAEEHFSRQSHHR